MDGELMKMILPSNETQYMPRTSAERHACPTLPQQLNERTSERNKRVINMQKQKCKSRENEENSVWKSTKRSLSHPVSNSKQVSNYNKRLIESSKKQSQLWDQQMFEGMQIGGTTPNDTDITLNYPLDEVKKSLDELRSVEVNISELIEEKNRNFFKKIGVDIDAVHDNLKKLKENASPKKTETNSTDNARRNTNAGNVTKPTSRSTTKLVFNKVRDRLGPHYDSLEEIEGQFYAAHGEFENLGADTLQINDVDPDVQSLTEQGKSQPGYKNNGMLRSPIGGLRGLNNKGWHDPTNDMKVIVSNTQKRRRVVRSLRSVLYPKNTRTPFPTISSTTMKSKTHSRIGIKDMGYEGDFKIPDLPETGGPGLRDLTVNDPEEKPFRDLALRMGHDDYDYPSLAGPGFGAGGPNGMSNPGGQGSPMGMGPESKWGMGPGAMGGMGPGMVQGGPEMGPRSPMGIGSGGFETGPRGLGRSPMGMGPGGPGISAEGPMGMSPGSPGTGPGGPIIGPKGLIMGPGGPGLGPRGPRMDPGGPGMVPRGPMGMGFGSSEMGPGGPGMGPEGPMGMGPGGPRMAPRGPGMRPGGPEMGPGSPGMGPGGPVMGPKGPGMGQEGPGMGPGGPRMDSGRPEMEPGGHGMGTGALGMGTEGSMGVGREGSEMGPEGSMGMGPGGPGMGPGGLEMGPRGLSRGPEGPSMGLEGPIGMGSEGLGMAPGRPNRLGPGMRPRGTGMGPEVSQMGPEGSGTDPRGPTWLSLEDLGPGGPNNNGQRGQEMGPGGPGGMGQRGPGNSPGGLSGMGHRLPGIGSGGPMPGMGYGPRMTPEGHMDPPMFPQGAMGMRPSEQFMSNNDIGREDPMPAGIDATDPRFGPANSKYNPASLDPRFMPDGDFAAPKSNFEPNLPNDIIRGPSSSDARTGSQDFPGIPRLVGSMVQPQKGLSPINLPDMGEKTGPARIIPGITRKQLEGSSSPDSIIAKSLPSELGNSAPASGPPFSQKKYSGNMKYGLQQSGKPGTLVKNNPINNQPGKLPTGLSILPGIQRNPDALKPSLDQNPASVGPQVNPPGVLKLPPGSQQSPQEGQQNPTEDQRFPSGGQQFPPEHNPPGSQQNSPIREKFPTGSPQSPPEGQRFPPGQNPSGQQFPPGQNSPGSQQFPSEGQQLPSGGQQFPPESQQLPPGGQQFPKGQQFPSGQYPPRIIPPGEQQFPLGQYPPGGQQFPPGQYPPEGQRFPPGQYPPGGQQFPPGQNPPGGQQFTPGQNPPGGQQFPPGQNPPGGQQFPPGQNPSEGQQLPPGQYPPERQQFPPGQNPPGGQQFPPGQYLPEDQQFPPGQYPPGSQRIPPGKNPPGGQQLPSGQKLRESQQLSPGVQRFPPGGQQFPQGQQFPSGQYPPGIIPPSEQRFPPGQYPPGGQQFPPGQYPPEGQQFPPGLYPPGGQQFPPGQNPPGGQQSPTGPYPPGGQQYPPGPYPPGGQQYPPGQYPPYLNPPGGFLPPQYGLDNQEYPTGPTQTQPSEQYLPGSIYIPTGTTPTTHESDYFPEADNVVVGTMNFIEINPTGPIQTQPPEQYLPASIYIPTETTPTTHHSDYFPEADNVVMGTMNISAITTTTIETTTMSYEEFESIMKELMPENQTPIRKSARANMRNKGTGILSEGVSQFCQILVNKTDDQIHDVQVELAGLASGYRLGKKLRRFGEPFTTEFLKFMKDGSFLDPQDVFKNMLIHTYHMLDNRHLLSRDLNALIEFADTLYEEREIAAVLTALEDLHEYPNSNDTKKQSLEALMQPIMDEILINPFYRFQGTITEKILVSAINTVVKEQVDNTVDLMTDLPPLGRSKHSDQSLSSIWHSMKNRIKTNQSYKSFDFTDQLLDILERGNRPGSVLNLTGLLRQNFKKTKALSEKTNVEDPSSFWKSNFIENITTNVKENITKGGKENITKSMKDDITKSMKDNITKSMKENITKNMKENVTKIIENKRMNVNKSTKDETRRRNYNDERQRNDQNKRIKNKNYSNNLKRKSGDGNNLNLYNEESAISEEINDEKAEIINKRIYLPPKHKFRWSTVRPVIMKKQLNYDQPRNYEAQNQQKRREFSTIDVNYDIDINVQQPKYERENYIMGSLINNFRPNKNDNDRIKDGRIKHDLNHNQHDLKKNTNPNYFVKETKASKHDIYKKVNNMSKQKYIQEITESPKKYIHQPVSFKDDPYKITTRQIVTHENKRVQKTPQPLQQFVNLNYVNSDNGRINLLASHKETKNPVVTYRPYYQNSHLKLEPASHVKLQLTKESNKEKAKQYLKFMKPNNRDNLQIKTETRQSNIGLNNKRPGLSILIPPEQKEFGRFKGKPLKYGPSLLQAKPSQTYQPNSNLNGGAPANQWAYNNNLPAPIDVKIVELPNDYITQTPLVNNNDLNAFYGVPDAKNVNIKADDEYSMLMNPQEMNAYTSKKYDYNNNEIKLRNSQIEKHVLAEDMKHNKKKTRKDTFMPIEPIPIPTNIKDTKQPIFMPIEPIPIPTNIKDKNQPLSLSMPINALVTKNSKSVANIDSFKIDPKIVESPKLVDTKEKNKVIEKLSNKEGAKDIEKIAIKIQKIMDLKELMEKNNEAKQREINIQEEIKKTLDKADQLHKDIKNAEAKANVIAKTVFSKEYRQKHKSKHEKKNTKKIKQLKNELVKEKLKHKHQVKKLYNLKHNHPKIYDKYIKRHEKHNEKDKTYRTHHKHDNFLRGIKHHYTHRHRHTNHQRHKHKKHSINDGDIFFRADSLSEIEGYYKDEPYDEDVSQKVNTMMDEEPTTKYKSKNKRFTATKPVTPRHHTQKQKEETHKNKHKKTHKNTNKMPELKNKTPKQKKKNPTHREKAIAPVNDWERQQKRFSVVKRPKKDKGKGVDINKHSNKKAFEKMMKRFKKVELKNENSDVRADSFSGSSKGSSASISSESTRNTTREITSIEDVSDLTYFRELENDNGTTQGIETLPTVRTIKANKEIFKEKDATAGNHLKTTTINFEDFEKILRLREKNYNKKKYLKLQNAENKLLDNGFVINNELEKTINKNKYLKIQNAENKLLDNGFVINSDLEGPKYERNPNEDDYYDLYRTRRKEKISDTKQRLLDESHELINKQLLNNKTNTIEANKTVNIRDISSESDKEHIFKEKIYLHMGFDGKILLNNTENAQRRSSGRNISLAEDVKRHPGLMKAFEKKLGPKKISIRDESKENDDEDVIRENLKNLIR